MLMFFYALENPKNTQFVLVRTCAQKLVSSVMLRKFYLYISRYVTYHMCDIITLTDGLGFVS